MGKVILITGTDTGVGKTILTAGLVRWFNSHGVKTIGMKPFVCGPNQDVKLLKEANRSLFPLTYPLPRGERNSPSPLTGEGWGEGDMIAPERWKAPLAPFRASRLEKKPIRWASVSQSLQFLRSQSDLVVMEGAGGLLCPLTSRITLADWAAKEGFPVLVVSRLGLGTLNHTLMTLEVAKARGIMVKGIILNDFPPGTRDLSKRWNPRDLEELTKTPVLGIFPFLKRVTVERSAKGWEKHFDFKRIYKIFKT